MIIFTISDNGHSSTQKKHPAKVIRDFSAFLLLSGDINKIPQYVYKNRFFHISSDLEKVWNCQRIIWHQIFTLRWSWHRFAAPLCSTANMLHAVLHFYCVHYCKFFLAAYKFFCCSAAKMHEVLQTLTFTFFLEKFCSNFAATNLKNLKISVSKIKFNILNIILKLRIGFSAWSILTAFYRLAWIWHQLSPASIITSDNFYRLTITEKKCQIL